MSNIMENLLYEFANNKDTDQPAHLQSALADKWIVYHFLFLCPWSGFILIWFETPKAGFARHDTNIVGSRYLEVQGTLWNTSRYPYLDITYLQNTGRYKPNNHISQMNI